MAGPPLPVDPIDAAAREEIEASGIPWDDESLTRLRGFMRGEWARSPKDAIAEVAANPVQAQEQARAFVRQVVNAAREEGADQVNQAILDRAVRRLCPGFWPFC